MPTLAIQHTDRGWHIHKHLKLWNIATGHNSVLVIAFDNAGGICDFMCKNEVQINRGLAVTTFSTCVNLARAGTMRRYAGEMIPGEKNNSSFVAPRRRWRPIIWLRHSRGDEMTTCSPTIPVQHRRIHAGRGMRSQAPPHRRRSCAELLRARISISEAAVISI